MPRLISDLKVAFVSFFLVTACWTFGRVLIKSFSIRADAVHAATNVIAGLPVQGTGSHSSVERLKKLLHDNRDGKDGPYSLENTGKDPSEGQCQAILKHLNGKNKGTFLEAGAHNGEFLSNSLCLEVDHGWTGILVEPVPWLYKELLKKNRRVISLEACLSPRKTEYLTRMRTSVDEENWKRGTGSLEGYLKVWGETIVDVDVQCFPLGNILAAAGMLQLDVLVLDIQGAEYDVLQTVPWDIVDIQLILVESDLANAETRHHVTRVVEELLASKGYGLVDRVSNDYFFLKGAMTNVTLINS